MEALAWPAAAGACIGKVGESLMSILLPTLFAFNTFIYALLGAFMYFIWREDRAGEFRFWSLAFFLNSGALLVYAASDLAAIPPVLAGALNLWGVGALWAGIRVFVEKPFSRVTAIAGGAIWILAFSDVSLLIRIDGRVTIAAAYAFSIAYELYSYNKERLTIARATAALSAFHGCFMALMGIYAQFVTVDMPMKSVYDSPIAKFMAAEGMSHGIVLGFMLLALSKVRATARQKIAALTDPLTGLGNRRAFDLAAERAIEKSRGTETLVLLVFDLDRFKMINDRFGHAEGDRVLRRFADVAARNTKAAGGVLARVGGEEFAALLICEPSTGLSTAERIRCDFAEEAATLADGFATVSAGVAAMQDRTAGLAALMRAADEALYMAKAAGRNRVFLSPDAARVASRATRNRFDDFLPPLTAA